MSFSQILFKRFIGSLFLLFFVGLFPFHSSLAGGSEEEMIDQQIEGFLSALIRTANSKEPNDKKDIKLQQILQRNCDMEGISRVVLKNYRWHRATPQKRRRFTRAFTAYFAQQLRVHLSGLGGHKIKIKEVEKDEDGYYYVHSSLHKGRNNRPLKWKVSMDGGSPRVVDLLVFDISVAQYEAGNIERMLQNKNNSLDLLIYELQPPREVKQQNRDGGEEEVSSSS